MTGIVQTLGTGAQAAQLQQTTADNTYSALQSQNLAVSGVDINQETVSMLTYQQAFQASSQYIATINTLLSISSPWRIRHNINMKSIIHSKRLLFMGFHELRHIISPTYDPWNK